jgi:hypothetical protein
MSVPLRLWHPGLGQRRHLQLVCRRAGSLLGEEHDGVGDLPRVGQRPGIDSWRPPPAYGSMPASTISSATWMRVGSFMS